VKVTNRVKCFFLMGCIFLIACNPLSIDTFDRGTELIGGTDSTTADKSLESGYAPKDHWSGQWRIINIWAEWCKPCWQEIPEFNQFFSLQKNKDIKLLGFNFDELEKAELLLLKEKMSIQFPILTQWPKGWVMPDIKGLPATIILSPDDEIIEILWGPQSLVSLNQAMDNASKVIARGNK